MPPSALSVAEYLVLSSPWGNEVDLKAMATTLTVKVWVATGLTPFDALIVMRERAGLSRDVPVRTPEAFNVTPVGSVPVSEKVGAGSPEALTLKEPAIPLTKVAEFDDVITGAWPVPRGTMGSTITPFTAPSSSPNPPSVSCNVMVSPEIEAMADAST